MASVYSQGHQHLETLIDLFVDGQLVIGNTASGTGTASITTVDFTPDFVIATMAGVNALTGWSATSTTLTITGRSATTACKISYIAGNLA